MATIQNERDKTLQAASVRFIDPPILDAVKGIEVTGTGQIFKDTGSGVSPATITLTATLRLLTGTVTWSVASGSVSITPSGNTCVVTGSSMASATATIRASITVDGDIYSRDYSIALVADGAPGSPGSPGNPGSPGSRGTVHAYYARPAASWSNANANTAILNLTGDATLIVGDLVTQHRQVDGWAETRMWTGSVWQFLEQVVDGNLIVTGSLDASKITTGEMTGNRIYGGIIQAAEFIGQGRIIMYQDGFFGGTLRPAYFVSSGDSGGNNRPEVLLGVNSASSCLLAVRNAYNHAIQAFQLENTYAAVQALNSANPHTEGHIATSGHAFYAVAGGYGPFTGVHEGLIESDSTAEPGDIVIDNGVAVDKSIIDVLFYIKRSQSAADIGAVGVLVQRTDATTYIPAAARKTPTELRGEPEACPFWDDIIDGHDLAIFAAVGEGKVNVCGRGGDISKGDLIVCSDMPGKGQRQADDIVRSYTVAKARTSVSFNGPDEVKLIPCIYLCG